MGEGTKQFQVLLCQLPYPWVREELERLWGDVTEQVERDQETRPGGSATGSVHRYLSDPVDGGDH